MGCNASKVSPHPVDGEPPEMTRQRKAILKAKGRWIAKHLLFPALAAAAKPEPGWQLPKLTAEQQAEWEEKKELIAEQIAEPNTMWDRLGASVLKLALADTKLVDAAWLAALADAGGVLPRCQDLPAEAVVTYEEMQALFAGVAVLVISYPWVRAAFEPTAPPPRTLIRSLSLCMWQLDADHPDKNGLQLRKLAFVLKAAAKEAAHHGFKFGVFWDYCACAAAPSNPRPNAPHRLSPSPLSRARPQAAAALPRGLRQGRGRPDRRGKGHLWPRLEGHQRVLWLRADESSSGR